LEIFDRINIDLMRGSAIYSSCNDTSLPMRWVYSHTGASTVLFTNEGGAMAASFQLSYYVDAELYHCGSFIMPALVVGQSVIITDGSKSTNLMRRGESCSWLIRPVQDCSVSLLVNWVSIKHGSYVNVYDGSSSSDSMLWNAVGATTTVPPIITSTGKSLFMEYFSGSAGAIRYFGFEAETSSLFKGSKGSGRGFSSLAMSSAIDIAPPIRYTGNNFYVWYIRPAQSIGSITFTVSVLALLYPGDQLLILDGDSSVDDDEGSLYKDRVLAQYSGNVLPLSWVMSSGTAATLLFRTADSSSSSVTSDLFKVSYHSDGPNYHCGFTTNPAVLTSPSFLFTDGSSSTEAVYDNQQCDWSIQLTTWNSSDAHSVVLLFDRFDLYGGGSLSIYREGGELFSSIMDSSAVPGPIVLGGQSVQVSYSTGAQSLGRGFSLIYYGAYSSHSFPGNNIVTLKCSSVVSLSMALDAEQLILPNTNLQWLLKPANSTGSIYLSLIALNLSEDCETNYLDIFDGETTNSTDHLMGRFCRGSVTRANYRWLQSTSSTALLHFVSDHLSSSSGNFDISYFSDGPNYHCGGFVVNPAHVRAPSMVFTDGSGSGLPIFSDQYCEWVLEPSWYLFADSSTAMGDSSVVIVIEFLQCDLQGGSVQLFDGRDAHAPLLWSCLSCSVIPFPIVSTGGVVFVRFETTASSTPSSSSSSSSEEERGKGFTLMYWSTSSSALHPDRSPLAAQELVLQLPVELQLTSDTDNATAGFSLISYDSSSTLEVHPSYVPRPAADAVRSISDESYDGRPHNSASRFESLLQKQRVCGTLLTSDSSDTYLQESDSLQYKPTQRLRSFLSSTASSKAVLSLHADSSDGIGEPFLAAPPVCKYRLQSGSAQAISVRIISYVVGSGRLRIFIGGTAEGMSFEDHLLYDSEAPPTRDSLLVSLGGVHMETTEEGDSYVQSMNVTIPCGKSTVIVEQNSSLLLRFGNLIGDTGEMCSRYVLSLQPAVEQRDPLIPVYIAAACIALIAVVGMAVLYIRHSLATQGYVLYPSRLKPPVYRQITPIHPPHGGRWDRLFNWLLPRGTCVVCKTSGARVLTLNCAHRMCVECVSGYVESALGDVSMFPVKCPMHFEGCAGNVSALIAKRVLGPSQYNRFNEFSDRAIYGDGNYTVVSINASTAYRLPCHQLLIDYHVIN
jgi:hypothetical protein